MLASLTIVRYPAAFIPVAFLSMAVFRLPLFMNRGISFYKLLGSGKNGTFDKQPDLKQWALLAVHNTDPGVQPYGNLISRWWKIFRCEVFTMYLQPVEGHGKWDGKNVFGRLNDFTIGNEPVATLTRATIRLNRLKYFWQNVAPVAQQMNQAKGLIFSAGIGEVPWVKQATFSIWQSKDHMKEFAYRMAEHKEVIVKTRQQQWYKEEMFVRFRILKSTGTLHGADPLIKLQSDK